MAMMETIGKCKALVNWEVPLDDFLQDCSTDIPGISVGDHHRWIKVHSKYDIRQVAPDLISGYTLEYEM